MAIGAGLREVLELLGELSAEVVEAAGEKWATKPEQERELIGRGFGMGLDIGLGDKAAEELAISGRGEFLDGEQSVEHALRELFRLGQERENGVFEVLVVRRAFREIGEFGFKVGDKAIEEIAFLGRLDFEEQDGELERRGEPGHGSAECRVRSVPMGRDFAALNGLECGIHRPGGWECGIFSSAGCVVSGFGVAADAGRVREFERFKEPEVEGALERRG